MVSRYFKDNSPSVFDEIAPVTNIENAPNEIPTLAEHSNISDSKSTDELSIGSAPILGSFANTDVMDVPSVDYSFEAGNDASIAEEIYPMSSVTPELERTYHAWIPSASNIQILKLKGSPNEVTQNYLLAMPGIAMSEDFGDPVANLVRKYLGDEEARKRQVSNCDSVTQDNRGLRQLIQNGCYNAALNLTKRLLTVYGQGEGRAGIPSKHTIQSLRLWFVRISLLVKLRRFSLAEVECQPFGNLDSVDLYFEYYKELYGDRKGTMVPFSFRLLVTELDQHLGKQTKSLDKLSQLLCICDEIIANLVEGKTEDGSSLLDGMLREPALLVWKKRRINTLLALTRCAAGLKDFSLSGSLIKRIIEENECIDGLYASLGRLCLQLGDVNSAQRAFKSHLESCDSGFAHDPVLGLLHSAYVSIAQSKFQEAAQSLQQAHKISPENALVINNLCVVMTYLGDIRGAIKTVETALFKSPIKLLYDPLIINICSLYEMETSNSVKKKTNILSLVSQHKGDGFNIAFLKLPT